MNKILKIGIVSLFLVAMLTFAIAGTTRRTIEKSVDIDERIVSILESDGIDVNQQIVNKGAETLDKEQREKIYREAKGELNRLNEYGTIEDLETALSQLEKINPDARQEELAPEPLEPLNQR